MSFVVGCYYVGSKVEEDVVFVFAFSR